VEVTDNKITLAHFGTELITAVQNFKMQAFGINLAVSSLTLRTNEQECLSLVHLG